LTTSIISQGTYNNSTEITDSATVAGTMSTTSTAGAASQATIYVTQANAAGTANESMTVTVDRGLVSSGVAFNTATRANAGRAITVKKGDFINVWSDGTSGVGTVKIVGQTSGATLGEEKITWYGSVASLTSTVRTAVVSTLGGGTSGTSAIVVTAKDSLGTVIPAGTLYLESSAQTSIPDASSSTATKCANNSCTNSWCQCCNCAVPSDLFFT